MDEQMSAGAMFMCRICNLFSPSHSMLLAHCSQVHLQQGSPDDIIIALQPLAAQLTEKPADTFSKRKRGRPKGSTNRRNKYSPGYTEDTVVIDEERKDKEQDESNGETLGLECKECHRTFSNKRQIVKHICLKVMEEEDEAEDDNCTSGTAKTKKKSCLQFENQISQSKEKALLAACKKSVIKVFLTEDETLPDVSKLVPVEESSTEREESVLAQAIPQSHPQDIEKEDADPSDISKTDEGPSLKPPTEAKKSFQEYSIKQDAACSLQSQLKIFTCEFCNKIFKFRHSLIAHLRTHTQEKPFKCPHCDYASAIKANLNVHLRKHTGARFHCEHCSFACLSSGHLKVHIDRVHLKLKHHCSFCKKKYSDVKNLLKHMEKYHNLKDAAVNKIYQELRLKTRQGLRQLLFHCPTCKRCFKSRQERERHLLVHGAQRPFACIVCEYAATKLSSLTAHVRKHFFLYVCCVCKDMFVSCHRLRTHLTESHPEVDQEQAFTVCISSSFQLIQPGGAIWEHDSGKQIDPTGQYEDMKMKEDVIGSGGGQEELQKTATSEGEVKQNQSESLEMEQVIEQETGMNLETEASSQNSQKERCQTSQNKTILSANLSEDNHNSNNNRAENANEQEACTPEVLSPEISNTGPSTVSDQKQKNIITLNNSTEATNTDLAVKTLNVNPPAPSVLSVADDKTAQSKKESEITFENAFLQALSTIQKTQLSMETLQQLRKVYGELECQYCGKLFASKVHHDVHVRTHTKEHLQYCAQCHYSSITKSSLSRHMIQKHSDLLLSCPNLACKYTTPDKYKLQVHVKRHHEETKSVSCPVCNNSYSEHRLRQHIRKVHPDTVPAESKGRMEKQADKCPYCDSYFLKNSNDFQQHIWAHEGLKPYTCNMCDYAGFRKSNLKLHMNRHKTEKSHLCDLCGKKFKSKVTLKSHTLSHTNEGKRFKCSECDFASALKLSLVRHMEQHARACQPFQCAHCYYSCNNVGPLKRHYKKKHPDQKYPDAVAEDSKTDAQEQQGALKCPVCESAHGTKRELNHHLKNKHRLNILEISFEENEPVETQYVPAEDEVQLAEVPVETLQDSEAVNILQQITELNSETHNVVTPMVAMAPGTVTVMEQIGDEQEIGSDQLMVVNADEDLAAEQVMVVEEADGLEALTVFTQGDSTHHYIVYVQEQTVEIN